MNENVQFLHIGHDDVTQLVRVSEIKRIIELPKEMFFMGKLREKGTYVVTKDDLVLRTNQKMEELLCKLDTIY